MKPRGLAAAYIHVGGWIWCVVMRYRCTSVSDMQAPFPHQTPRCWYVSIVEQWGATLCLSGEEAGLGMGTLCDTACSGNKCLMKALLFSVLSG